MSEMALTIKSDKSEPLPPFIAKLWKLLQDDRFYRAPSFRKPQCNQYRSFWSIIISVSHGLLPHIGRLRSATPASSARSEIVHAACATTLIGTRRTTASLCTIRTGFRRMFSLNSSRRITSRLSSASSTSTTSGRCRTIRCAVPPAAVSASPGADVGRGGLKSRCRCGRGHYSFAA